MVNIPDSVLMLIGLSGTGFIAGKVDKRSGGRFTPEAQLGEKAGGRAEGSRRRPTARRWNSKKPQKALAAYRQLTSRNFILRRRVKMNKVPG